MDKVKLNNQIVLMRKFVKLGKVHLMSKLLREAQRLEKRKGKEHQVAKCKRKAERLHQQIDILKKITPDSVSKMALSQTKDWKVVLSQKGISLETRCYAWLANYGPVQAEVERFFNENSDLIPKIPVLILEWDEKAVAMSTLKNKKALKAKSKNNEDTNQTSKEKNKVVSELESCKRPVKEVSKRKHIVSKIENVNKVDNDNDQVKSDDNDELDSDDNNQVGSDDNDQVGSDDNDQVQSDDNDQVGSDDNGKVDSDDNDEVDSDDDQIDSDDDDNQEGSGKNKIEIDECEASDDASEEEGSNNSLQNKKILSNKKQLKNKLIKNSLNIKSKKVERKEKTLKKTSVVKDNECKNEIPNLQKDVPLESNSTKAVALVNLNELMDMDEIPISSNVADKETSNESKKRKRDAFFLKDGEEFSESEQSEGEDSKDDERTDRFMHKNSFNKKRPFTDHGGRQTERNPPNFKKGRFFTSKPQGKEFRHNNKFGNDFPSKNKFQKFEKNEKKSFSTQKGFGSNQKDFGSSQKGFGQNKWKSDKSDGKGFKPFNSFQGKKEILKNQADKHPKNASHPLNQTAKPEGPLHPSWEAKRKLKQATNTKFQGKRMVFND